MKNANNPDQPKHDLLLSVSVTIDEAPLLKNLVEKLAHRRQDLGFGCQQVPEGWRAVETSSLEAYISGCMDIQGSSEYIALSYTTCFSFTCIKVFGGENSLAWINSLS